MSEPEPAALDLLPLASVPMSEWPALARMWLGEGHHSELLADFAVLSPAEAHVLAAMMLEVLRSLGIEIPPGNDIGAELFAISGLARRCRRALEPVAADLQRTWKPIAVRVMTASDEPPLFVQVIIGTDVTAPSGAMTADMSEGKLLVEAATQVSEALLEVAGYQWPFCIAHNRRMVVGSSDQGRTALWRCDGPQRHSVAEVGQLTAGQARSQQMWWAAQRNIDLTLDT